MGHIKFSENFAVYVWRECEEDIMRSGRKKGYSQFLKKKVIVTSKTATTKLQNNSIFQNIFFPLLIIWAFNYTSKLDN